MTVKPSPYAVYNQPVSVGMADKEKATTQADWPLKLPCVKASSCLKAAAQ